MTQNRRLTQGDYDAAKSRAVKYLSSHPAITNRLLRSLMPITYDEAIIALGKMCQEGLLERHGHAGGSHYVLAQTKDKTAM